LIIVPSEVDFKRNDKTEPQITQISQIQSFGIRRCVPDPVRPEQHRNDR